VLCLSESITLKPYKYNTRWVYFTGKKKHTLIVLPSSNFFSSMVWWSLALACMYFFAVVHSVNIGEDSRAASWWSSFAIAVGVGVSSILVSRHGMCLCEEGVSYSQA
jgi:hypothetical protein